MQSNTPSFKQRWSKAKPTKMMTFWIVVAAIVLMMIYGFTRGGWVTGGTSQKASDTAAQTAVVERLAPMCVAQFNQDPQKADKLASLKLLSSSGQRAKYVTEQGWATMPGEAAADSKVALECSKRLMLLAD